MPVGGVVLVVAVALVAVFGLWRHTTDGRFRSARPADEVSDTGSVLAGTPWAESLGERATLLQFSSAFCAPCRVTRQVLAEVARESEGVVHLEVDAEQHLELVRRLGILRTPTTLILGPTGQEVTRAAGAPTIARVRGLLAALGAREGAASLEGTP